MKLIDSDLLGLTDMEIIMCSGDYKEAFKIIIDKINNAPTIEPRSIEQICWERDLAIQQLADLGYGLGEKTRTDGDCISRQAVIEALVKAIRENPYYDSDEAINGLGVCDVRVILNDLPSVQPERKKGKWIYGEEGCFGNPYGHYECSKCGDCFPHKENFCPNCGADMREV